MTILDTINASTGQYGYVKSSETVAEVERLINLDYEFQGQTSTVIGEPIDSRISELKDRLHEILVDCNTSDWDGYGAKPISREAAQAAESIIQNIGKLAATSDILLPEISPAPDGTVLFDWLKGEDRFSLAISEDKNLIYAMVGPSRRVKGCLPFDKSLPAVLREILLSFFSV